jgi:DNA-binding MarR family transcriptional regulator
MVDVKHSHSVWRRLIELLQTQKFWMDELASELGITAHMVKALVEIPARDSITMKELAGRLWCDASNTTGIVDRLEARGYAERRPDPRDRRVKCVLLTAAGRRIQRKIDEHFTTLPPALAALSDADQAALSAIIDRALANAQRQLAEPIERAG